MSSGDIRYARPSILERLRHAGQSETRSTYDTRASVDSLRDEVRRNIEALLNTRRPDPRGFRDYPQASTSHLVFGIPDLTALSKASNDDVIRLTREIEVALRVFEPRLDPATVRVEKVRDSSLVTQMRFMVSGTLKVHPYSARVEFDTRVDIEKGDVEIQDVET